MAKCKRSCRFFLSKENKTVLYLVLANVILAVSSIVLNNSGSLPLPISIFVALFLAALALAFWRPGWIFLLFCGAIILENINLAPAGVGIAVRPYQLLGGALFLATLARHFSRRSETPLLKPALFDYLIWLIPLATLLRLPFSDRISAGVKFFLVIVSFSILFWLARQYLRSLHDIKKTLPFIFSSSLVVILYGLWQNIRFAAGEESFAVMPGRPNSTFTEPDWLGLYLVLVFIAACTWLYFSLRATMEEDSWRDKVILPVIIGYLAFVLALLIISVSRSAWLGASVASVVLLFATLTGLSWDFQAWRWKLFLRSAGCIAIAILLAAGAIPVFHLTTFQLANRASSVGTGEQSITVSCFRPVALPEKIASLNDLTPYACHQINLEDISMEKTRGHFVTTVDRQDPNVSIRSQIYANAWKNIIAHPLVGIGWENIGPTLGQDERGASLNSSNIFLEVWLGAGLLGLLALISLFGLIFYQAIDNFFHAKDLEDKTLDLFVLSSLVGIVVFNLFNAGILLGIFWLWLGANGVMKRKKA